MTIELILLCISAYLLGSVPFALLLAKWFYGIDIREHGTGKVGAANVLRVVSKWLAILVAFFDIGKGALMVWATQLFGMEVIQQVSVGIFAIIGHNWPVFLRFKGGRGILTSLGVVIMLSPWLGLIMLSVSYILAPIHQVAFGVFLASVSLPFLSWFLGQGLGIDERLPITIGFIIISLMVWFKRLFVPRTELSKSISIVELIINRLLFDRDIRDAKTWIQRNLGK
ncbi:MAG: glycerol-3-phosphate acyltransferase [Dehalococcoidia bacterium]|nr:MAG: glycerol-3-phosphate acyltransferase [Dehalococcoidia bacterium]